MVWGCFVGNKLGPIVSIDSSITGDKYVSLLQENLWAYLKVELHRRYLDTATLCGFFEYIRQKISERVHEVWWLIGEDILNHLIDSMPHRVKALIKAQG